MKIGLKTQIVSRLLCLALPVIGFAQAATENPPTEVQVSKQVESSQTAERSSENAPKAMPEESSGDTADAQAMVALTQQIVTYEATYEQKITDEFGNLKDKAKGQFLLKKPYQFIWQTNEPYEQKIVSDGTDLWTYDLDLEQVNVQTLDTALGATPALLIASDINLLTSSFKVQELPSGNPDVNTFELIPKELGQAFERVLLLFKDKQLVEILMFDTLSQRTVVSFTQVKLNHEFAADTFKFIVPDDVDLVDSRKVVNNAVEQQSSKQVKRTQKSHDRRD